MKAVLFDLDETILDRRQSIISFCEWQAADSLKLKEVDLFVSRFLELDANGSVWKDKVYERLAREFSIKRSVDDLVAEYILEFKNFCRARPGALDAIRCVAGKGYMLGLVSNGKSPFQEDNFKSLGVSSLFSSVVVSEAVGFSKPNPTIFEISCKALEVEPAECIFVGDNPESDIRGATAVGMYTVFVPGFYSSECLHAHAICSDFRDLPEIVENAVNKQLQPTPASWLG